MLCNHHHRPSPRFFSSSKNGTPYPLNNSSLFLPPSSPWELPFCLYDFFFFWSGSLLDNTVTGQGDYCGGWGRVSHNIWSCRKSNKEEWDLYSVKHPVQLVGSPCTSSLSTLASVSSFAKWGQEQYLPHMIFMRKKWINTRKIHRAVPGTS